MIKDERLILEACRPDHTMLIIIDMNNGFAKEGALYSPRVEALIEPITDLAEKSISRDIKVLAYSDKHPEGAREFLAYPPHCQAGSTESELVPSLKALLNVGMELHHKNSTNGILAYNPAHEIVGIANYIVVGCVTDICVYQYAVTLRAYLNEHNLEGQVIVSKKHMDTYHIDQIHDGDTYQEMAINLMAMNGVKVVEDIVI